MASVPTSPAVAKPSTSDGRPRSSRRAWRRWCAGASASPSRPPAPGPIACAGLGEHLLDRSRSPWWCPPAWRRSTSRSTSSAVWLSLKVSSWARIYGRRFERTLATRPGVGGSGAEDGPPTTSTPRSRREDREHGRGPTGRIGRCPQGCSRIVRGREARSRRPPGRWGRQRAGLVLVDVTIAGRDVPRRAVAGVIAHDPAVDPGHAGRHDGVGVGSSRRVRAASGWGERAA